MAYSKNTCACEICNEEVGEYKSGRAVYCKRHRNPATRHLDKKVFELIKRGFTYDGVNKLVIKYGKKFLVKDIHFSHFLKETKLENKHKGKGDQRGRNNPADLSERNYPAFKREMLKCWPIPEELHSRLHSLEDIGKSEAPTRDTIMGLIEASGLLPFYNEYVEKCKKYIEKLEKEN